MVARIQALHCFPTNCVANTPDVSDVARSYPCKQTEEEVEGEAEETKDNWPFSPQANVKQYALDTMQIPL